MKTGSVGIAVLAVLWAQSALAAGAAPVGAIRCKNNPDESQRYEASVYIEGAQTTNPTRILRVYDIANVDKAPIVSQPIVPDSDKTDGVVKFTSASVQLNVDYDKERCALKARVNGKVIDQSEMLLEN